MSKIRRVDYSPDEFLSGTSDLTAEEKGCYWVVCSLIYSRGGPIADDDKWIAKVAGCSARTWRPIRERLIGMGKLIAEGGTLSNRRAMIEIGNAENRIGQAHAAAEKSAEVRRLQAEARAQKELENSSKVARNLPESSSKVARTELETEGDSSEINDLGRAAADSPARANHQPSTTKVRNGESLTVERIDVSADAPPPSPSDKRRGSRLPEGWRPEGELRQWTLDAIHDAESSVSAGHELEKFADYWKAATGTKAVKADWPATWRNWIRRAIENEKGPRNGKPTSTNRPQRRSQAAVAAAFIAGLGGSSDRGPGGGGN